MKRHQARGEDHENKDEKCGFRLVETHLLPVGKVPAGFMRMRRLTEG